MLFEEMASPYIMSMFGKGLCAGHHGCRSFLQLAQFLPSLVQSYPGASQVAHNPGRCAFHALHAPRARDVLGQAAGGLASCCFTDYQSQKGKSI